MREGLFSLSLYIISRSYKKYPIAGIIAAESEKKDKRIANRVYRAYIRMLIYRALHQDKDITKGLLDRRTVTNVYSFSKDGKRWYRDWHRLHPRIYRK